MATDLDSTVAISLQATFREGVGDSDLGCSLVGSLLRGRRRRRALVQTRISATAGGHS